MKSSSEMKGTNRMVFRLDNGEKIIIDRKNCKQKDEYVLSIPWYIKSEENSITEDDLLVVRRLSFDEDCVEVDALLLKNFNYKTVYFNNNGYIDTYYEAFYPNPEESTYSKNIQLRITKSNAFCTDLDMYEDMLKDGMIIGDVDELAKYGLYKKPEVTLVKGLAKNK